MRSPRRSWWLAAVWAIGVATVAVTAALPDPYLRRLEAYGRVEPQGYPLAGVFLFTLIVTAECAALWAILRPGSYDRSWLRAAFAAALAAFLTLFFSMGLTHAPIYFFGHVWWLLGVTVTLSGLFLASLGASLWGRWKATS